MVIKFHCENCGHKVQAPDEHGGKRGKCPFCDQSIYIPSAPQENSEIPLAPLSDEDEQTRESERRDAAAMRLELERMAEDRTLDAEPKKATPDEIRKRMKETQ